MDRRHFLKTSTAAALATGINPCKVFALTDIDTPIEFGEEKLKVGIISDIHVKYSDPISLELTKKAFEFFKLNKIDAVMIAGDMADQGLSIELESMMKVWYEVFPKDKGIDARHIEKLFVFGNHDSDGAAWGGQPVNDFGEEKVKEMSLNLHRQKYWKKFVKEDYEDIYIKEIKGYKFIGAHVAFNNISNIPNLKSFMDSHSSELTGDKPFFFFQHPHPKDTCSSPFVWGQDDGTTTKILSDYPNCIAFSGHSHNPLCDERTIWQGSFTSVGTASLRRIIPLNGRDNSDSFESMSKAKPQMKPVNGFNCHNGQIMTVYDKYITLDRYEIATNKSLGRWVIQTSVKNGTPMSFSAREKSSIAPEFAPDSKIEITRILGKDRSDNNSEQIVISFPVATSTKRTPRAFDYEVQLEYKDCDTCKIYTTRRVYSNGYFLSEDDDRKEPAKSIFAIEELPDNREFRFVVRPCENFGHKGQPLVTDWLSRDKIIQ